MFLKFDEELQKVFMIAIKEKSKRKSMCLGTEHILLGILSFDNYLSTLLKENNVTYKKVSKYILDSDCEDNYIVYSDILIDVINSLYDKGSGSIGLHDLFLEIVKVPNSKVNYILKKLSVSNKLFLKRNKNVLKNREHKLLDELCINLNEKFKNSDKIVYEREDEINSIIEILSCKNKNNPLLIGDAGVGKTSIIEELARRIECRDVPISLINKKIYSLSMSSVVAGTKYRGEFEEKLNNLISELIDNDDIILFIDEVHTIVNAGGADGAIDASNILKPYLTKGDIKIIGATTKDEYKKYFSFDKALSRRFKTIMIDEVSSDMTFNILKKIKNSYEKFHNVIISDSVLRDIIYYCDIYILNKRFPDKCIDVLDECCVRCKKYKNNFSVLSSLEKDLDNCIQDKNRFILDNDYENAIIYSKKEKEIRSKINVMDLKVCKKKYVVSKNDVLDVISRYTKFPFFIDDRYINKYKKISLFKNNELDLLIKRTKAVINNLLTKIGDNVFFIECNNYKNYFINSFVDYFFKGSNVINLDINNINNIDDLLCDYSNKKSFLSKIKENIFSTVIVDNYNINNKYINEFFEFVIKNKYYIDLDGNKVDFSSVVFMFLVKDESVGFVDSSNYILLTDLDRNKIFRYIRKYCLDNDIIFSKSVCNYVYSSLDNSNINSIDLLIRSA